ncbi:fimbrial isopeptide formation D2 domain protein [Lysobacter capsici]|nr:fimbrial isopeptide formation D2 domain protein [Lysobacter capsici]
MLSLCVGLQAHAQFKVSENFRNSTAPGWTIIGTDNGFGDPTFNSGVLTSGRFLPEGITDSDGDGWLRLTQNMNNQVSSALYTGGSFSGAMGVFMEVDYVSWGGDGADGLSFFLWDTSKSMADAGFGGGLGYCDGSASYLGVGLDEWGNFSSLADPNVPQQCNSDGPGFIADRMVLRGPMSSNNQYVGGTPVPAGIDDPGSQPERPVASKVRVALVPNGTGGYRVSAAFGSRGAEPTTLLNFLDFPFPAPAQLSVGFAGSTGDSVNVHEVRDAVLSTPADIVVTKDVSAASIARGQPVTYTVKFRNNDINPVDPGEQSPPIDSANAPDIVDTLPAQLTGASWTCSASAGSTCPAANGSGNLDFENGYSFAPGGELTFTITATVLPATACGATVSNTAAADFSATDGFADINLADNHDDASFTVVCPTVTYAKAATLPGAQTNVVPGDTISYTLTTTVANWPTSDVLTLTDTLGTGLSFGVVTSTGNYTCNAESPIVCTLPAGTAVGSYAVTYTATVNSQAGSTVNNAVTGAGTDAPTCPANNCSINTPVTKPVVTYAKAASLPGGQTAAAVGDTITYTVTTTVADAATSAVVTLTDTLSTGLTFGVEGDDGDYTCTRSGSTLTCTLPAGTAPGTYPLIYTATVNSQAGATVNNAVVGTGADAPTCPANDCSVTTPVSVPAIDAVNDTPPAVGGVSGGSAGNVYGNDTLNGAPVNPADVNGTVLTPATPINGGPVPTLDPVTGEVTVPAGTPAGTYTITYQICEKLNPSNCDQATVTVPVTSVPIDAVDDTPPAVGGVSGGSAGNAYGNDTLNGAPVNPADLNGTVLTPATPINGGPVPTLDPVTGEVTVPAGTPAGTYTITYQICEKLNPSNCDQATVTVPVTAVPIDAVNDTQPAVGGVSGGSAGNAYGNDTMNGAPVNPADVNGTVLTPATPINGGPVPTLDPVTGEVTVPAGTPSGSYTITYQICEKLNPSNCDQATVTVPVTAVPIDAVNDTPPAVSGVSGGSAGNAYDNDSLNGAPVNPADLNGTVLTPATPINGGPVPTLDPVTGNVTVPAGTPAGNYTITYQICEKLNPSNCDQATVTVPVTAATINAENDTPPAVSGTTGGSAGNAYDNDSLNGAPVNPAGLNGTVLTPATPINGGPVPALDPVTGNVTVPAGTPAGNYTITYQICEKLNPSNCDDATVTVPVTAPVIDAVDDGFGPVPGTNGGNAGNAYDNDTLGGAPVDPADVNGTVLTPATPINGGPVPTLDPATGNVTVPAGTPAGNYTITYQICEKLNPSNCDQATATVPVTAPVIDAVDDGFPPVPGANGGNAGNAYDNDTLGGTPVDPADVNGTVLTPATPINGGPVPTLDPATGNVTVPAGTPAGNYTITYQICEKLNPSNCDQATVTVPVTAPVIDAVDDGLGPVPGTNGGNAGNAYGNDTLGGAPVDPADVNGTVLTPATPINGGPVPTLDPATGNVTVPAGTPAGNYTITYQICEKLNPSNCDQATVTVPVTAPVIDAVDDDFAPTPGTNGGNVGNAYNNDRLNGAPVDPTNVTGTVLTPATPINGGPVPMLDPATGNVMVPPGTPAGTYTITYQICEKLNPSNCDQATVTVAVAPPTIDTVDDDFAPTPGTIGGTAGNAYDNDKLNGAPVDPASVTGTVLTPATPINGGPVPTLDPATGNVMLPPGTPGGTYTIRYQICEKLNPSNCDQATVTVVVTAPVIDAVDDRSPQIDGSVGGNAGNAYTSDTLNRVAVNPADIVGSVITPATSAGVVLDPATGNVSVARGTQGGTYTIRYQICERLNPSNCDQATVTVVVVNPAQIRVLKTAAVRTGKIGDLIRYTLTVENVGSANLIDGYIVDTPPAGFSYVAGSLQASDDDSLAVVSGQSPLRFGDIDLAAGKRATLVYLMRIGSGVRPGTQVNSAQAYDDGGKPVSNIATAEIQIESDSLIDDSLVFGTVFNDRDRDGWQDSAALSGVRVQGGFAPESYIANSTTVDRGAGPQSEPDASSPMLHGVEVGAISARQSPADPVEAHRVVIRQRLRELSFTDDFVLTSAQGVTVRMDAAGKTTVAKTGEAAKGLNVAEPTVERRVAVAEGGYVVDYVIGNAGIDENGIPGVRIASVEGLLIETDQFGRYHLANVPGGTWERGRNFILKVDPSTLPTGSEFTTDNPLLRRITPGIPVRFDWGVKLPEQVIGGGEGRVELELGEVFFAPGSAEVREQYLQVVDTMAAKVREYRGGEVVINANGENEGLAFKRADAIKAALLERLDKQAAKALVISVRADVDNPSSMVVGVAEGGALLGTLLFDTDKSAIRPEFEPLLDQVAASLERMGGGSIAVVGHTDLRASYQYNVALGMRRAQAVYEALAKRLSPQVRAKVRVEANNNPAASVGATR